MRLSLETSDSAFTWAGVCELKSLIETENKYLPEEIIILVDYEQTGLLQSFGNL